MKKPGELIPLALYVASLEAIIPHKQFTPEHLDYLSGVGNGFENKYTNLYQPSEDFNRLDPTRPKRLPQRPTRAKQVILGPKLPLQARTPKHPKKVGQPPKKVYLRPRPPGANGPPSRKGPKKSIRAAGPWRSWESDVQEPLGTERGVNLRPPPMRRPAHFLQRPVSKPGVLPNAANEDMPEGIQMPDQMMPTSLESEYQTIDKEFTEQNMPFNPNPRVDPGFSPSMEDLIKSEGMSERDHIDSGFNTYPAFHESEYQSQSFGEIPLENRGDDYQELQHMPFNPAFHESDYQSQSFGEMPPENIVNDYQELLVQHMPFNPALHESGSDPFDETQVISNGLTNGGGQLDPYSAGGDIGQDYMSQPMGQEAEAGGGGGVCGEGQGGCCVGSNAGCPAYAPVCSEWGYCQCSTYTPGGGECGPGFT